MMKHVLSADQYDKDSLNEVFDLTNKIKDHPKEYSNKLSDKIIMNQAHEQDYHLKQQHSNLELKSSPQKTQVHHHQQAKVKPSKIQFVLSLDMPMH